MQSAIFALAWLTSPIETTLAATQTEDPRLQAPTRWKRIAV